MARARMIKPQFFTNEELPDLDAYTRLLFIGLWTIADREGRLEDRPRKIKAEIYPYETVDVDAMLSSLGAKGFIHRYTVEGSAYIQVVNFLRHQRPHHNEAESNIPECPQDFPRSKGLATKDESASSFNIDTRTLNIDSLSDDKASPAPTKTSKEKTPRKQPETFVPESFPLEDRHYEYARKTGLTDAETEYETESFLLWHGAKQTRYGNWYMAWQTWIRNAVKRKNELKQFPTQSAKTNDPADAPGLTDDQRYAIRKLERMKTREWMNSAEALRYNGFNGDEHYAEDLIVYGKIAAGEPVPTRGVA